MLLHRVYLLLSIVNVTHFVLSVSQPRRSGILRQIVCVIRLLNLTVLCALFTCLLVVGCRGMTNHSATTS